jgi:hypothetical protein
MHETIAVIFDFDDTLAPDSTSGYLNDVGLKDLQSFWKKEVAALTSIKNGTNTHSNSGESNGLWASPPFA